MMRQACLSKLCFILFIIRRLAATTEAQRKSLAWRSTYSHTCHAIKKDTVNIVTLKYLLIHLLIAF